MTHFHFIKKGAPADTESFDFGFLYFSVFYPLPPHHIKMEAFILDPVKLQTKHFIGFSIHMKSHFSLCFANKAERSQGNFKIISFFSPCLSLTFWWWWENVSCSSFCWWNPIKDQKEKKLRKCHFCLKDNTTSGFKLQKTIYLDI